MVKLRLNIKQQFVNTKLDVRLNFRLKYQPFSILGLLTIMDHLKLFSIKAEFKRKTEKKKKKTKKGYKNINKYVPAKSSL